MKFTQDWFSRHIDLWKNMIDVSGDFLEIGAFEGRSCIWLLENYSCNVTVIDTFDGSEEHAGMNINNDDLFQVFQENTKSFQDRIKVIRKRSLDGLIELYPAQFDLIHVDGSHQSRDVYTDVGLAWNMLKPGGIMICDDYDWIRHHYQNTPWMTPKPALDGFLASFQDYEELHKDYQLILRKI